MLQYLYKRFARSPQIALAVLLFALTLVSVLRGLDASAQAQQRSYEQTWRTIPVQVTITNLSGTRSDDLDVPGWLADTFTGNVGAGLGYEEYVKDLVIKNSIQINNQYPDTLITLVGINALEADPVLNTIGVTWFPGYDASMLTNQNDLCLIPEGYSLDYDPETPGQQIPMHFRYSGKDEYYQPFTRELDITLTAAGTYPAPEERIAYCAFETVKDIQLSLWKPRTVDSISAMLSDNSLLADLIGRRSLWFAEPVPGGTKTEWGKWGYEHYLFAMDINDSLLRQAAQTLETNMFIHQVCRILVFALSALAGIFLGWLTIRQRSREIGLLRTLGTSNRSIFLGFFLEQALCLALGIALGSGLALENAATRLPLFGGLYCLGLMGSLLIFLNKNLLFTLKEDE